MDENHDREVDIRDYMRIIRRRFWVILGVVVASIILSFLYFFYSSPIYRSSSTIVVKKVESLFGGGYFPSPTKEELTNHIYLLKSEPVLLKTAESFSSEELKKTGFDSTYSAYERIKSDVKNGRIKIGAEGESRAIKIEVTESNPYRSQLFANRLAETYRAFDIERNREDAHSAYSFITEQAQKVKNDLEEAGKKLKEFKEKYGTLGVSSEVDEFVRQMALIEKEYKEASIDAEVLGKKLSAIESRLDDRQKTLLSEASQTSYSVLVDLKDQLTRLENEKANLLIKGYSATDLKIQSVDQSIQSIKEKMDNTVRNLLEEKGILDPLVQMKDLLQKSLNLTIDYAVASTRKEAFGEALNYYMEKLEKIPEKELKLARLEREEEANKKIYMMLVEKRETAKIEEARQSGGISILDLSRFPEEPDLSSKAKKGILFIILGILLGIGAGFVVDYIDSAIRDAEEITRITGLPVLGAIPLIKNRDKPFILMNENLKSLQAEAFRSLRANIKLSRPNGIPSSLLITGPDANCGKSTIAINLALSFASVGKRVLLVDTDLRKPAIEAYLGISSAKGLTDLLVDSDEDFEFFNFNGIDVIPTGTLPPNPSELLDSERMRKLLRKWEKDYDILILDSPPIMAVSDSRVLASEVEETILVVAYGETTRPMVSQSTELLKSLSIKSLGFILNKVSLKREYGYYSYYYHKYDKKRS